MTALAVLTKDETVAFDAAEDVIRAGIRTFVAVGNALVEVRDRRLYRQDFPTFEAYCSQRWGFGRNYVNKVVSAAKITGAVAGVVGTGVPIPATERQARELAPLRDDPDAAAAAWSTAVVQAAGGQPTATEVRDVVRRLNTISDEAEKTVSKGAPRTTSTSQPARRRPLPDAMRDAVYELRKAAERVERLTVDDRFTSYADTFFASYDADLTTVAAIVDGLGGLRRAARR